MAGPPFQNTALWALAAAPLGVLAAAGLLGDVPGEWSRACLARLRRGTPRLVDWRRERVRHPAGTRGVTAGAWRSVRRLRGAQPRRCPGSYTARCGLCGPNSAGRASIQDRPTLASRTHWSAGLRHCDRAGPTLRRAHPRRVRSNSPKGRLKKVDFETVTDLEEVRRQSQMQQWPSRRSRLLHALAERLHFLTAWQILATKAFPSSRNPGRPRWSLTSPSDRLTSRRQRHDISHREEMVPKLSNVSEQSQTQDPAIQSRPVVAINNRRIG
jgi:hypothetical protein